MDRLANATGIGLAMAVWLAHDDYTDGADQHPDKTLISATTLIKPTRQFVLSARVLPTEHTTDVTDLISSSFGTAIHDSVEHAWHNYPTALKRLGHPQKVIDSVRINPTDEELESDNSIIPVYLEQRYMREIGGVVISGKFDQIIDGSINDIKTTSVYTYLNSSKVEDYRIQLSIYRWLNPEKVTSDIGYIQHVFTDWQRMMVKQNPNYPTHRVIETKLILMSLEETEEWIINKLTEMSENYDLDQDDMVRCSDKELWRSDPVWKYYADPNKTKRSTKNFTDPAKANSHLAKAGKGIVKMIPGKVRACSYCNAFSVCKQREEYDHE